MSLTSLAILYYVLGFVVFNGIGFRQLIGKGGLKGLGWMRIIWGVLMGFGTSMISMGLLFKMQIWPGAETMLLSGSFLTLMMVVAGLIAYLKNRAAWLKPPLLRATIIAGIGLLLFTTADATLVDIQHRNDPELAEAVKEALQNPDNPELWEKVEELEQARYSGEDD